MFTRLRSYLTALTRRDGFEESLDEEVRFHLDAYARDLVRSGVPAAEARRRARLQFGSVEGAKDGCRRARGLRLADEAGHVMTNIRLALRMLLKTPVVTGVAILSLALGIGSNTAIFSLYSQLVLRPLPVADPDGLVNLASPGPKPGPCDRDNAGTCDETFSYPMFRDLEREQGVFTSIAAHKGLRANVVHQGRAATVQGTQVSGSYFATLGLRPAAGRLFGPEIDGAVGGHPVVVLSHDFWQAEFGGSPDALGDVLVVNGTSLTIVGVGPPGFRGTTINMPCDFFVPITMNGLLSRGRGSFDDRRAYWTYLFARLEPGVSVEQARAVLEPLYRSILADVEAPLQTAMSAQTLAQFIERPLQVAPGRLGQSRMSRDVQRVGLLFVLGITGAVLLIACANIANLQLARSAARAGEMAVRLSLGASRRHLLTQLLTESCLLALLAGAVALVLAHWTLRFVWALLPGAGVSDVLRGAFEFDPNAIPFTAAVSLATAVAFGLVPALYSTRVDPIAVLKDEAGQPGGNRSAARFRRGLVVAQLALALTLLVVSGLFIESLRNRNRIDLGFRLDGVVTFSLRPELSGYGAARNRDLFERVETALSARPGVAGVTASTGGVLAFTGGGGAPRDFNVQGFEAGSDTNRTALLNHVGTDYFRTLGIPLLAGRTFSASDTAGAPRVAIVNEAFARKFDLGRNPVGMLIGRGDLDAERDTEIVGLVADTRPSFASTVPPPLAFVPYRQEDVGGLWFFVRGSGRPDDVMRSIPGLVAGIDRNLPVVFLMPLARMAELNDPSRVATVLLTAFAALAMLLAAVGLYGVLAYAVALRTRELGLRMALGADARRLRAMVLGQVGRMALAGGAIGLALALGLERVLRSLLYEIDSLPLGVFAAALAGLAAVALASGLGPAHRASRIHPMEALRHK